MDVVDTGHVDCFAAADKGYRFVDQYLDTHILQRFDHVGGIVIAERGEDALPRLDGVGKFLEVGEDLFERAMDAVAVIARQDT